MYPVVFHQKISSLPKNSREISPKEPPDAGPLKINHSIIWEKRRAAIEKAQQMGVATYQFHISAQTSPILGGGQ